MRLDSSLSDDMSKWDEDYVKNELAKYQEEKIERVWVCGPPNMNETFDRAFTNMIEDGFPLDRAQYEII